MIPRAMADKLRDLAETFPAVTLTGPRQSGKSTLVKETFPQYRYVSLEDADVREAAREDPHSFLSRYDSRVIFDEAQRAPELFSYMQGVIDSSDELGQYVLSGSQNFLLLKSISQSLAGRVAVLHLLPLSYAELVAGEKTPATIDDFLFTGGYPQLNATKTAPADYFRSYVATYVDRDVREELGVRRVAQFNAFLTMCATRIGEVLNIEGLANDCDISVDTARSWLSILESSFIAFRLHPFHKNYGKRLIKAPKLYFYDTGLAANLLGVESAEELMLSRYRGSLYENAVVVEIAKQYEAIGREPKLFYWRDSNQKEIDLIIEKGGEPQYAIEVKSSATYRSSAFKTLEDIAPAMGLDPQRRFVVYGGDESFETKHGQVLGLADLNKLVS
ncbi:ATP-binding protein [Bifidobacterium panos]|uniref:ATPase AAA n=1 Tax=Bifidobacterium panos TaxID=2675321 RepID=A0ABX1T070_9BIFI|nr:ATP-binding protein [Bifidobacterium sp. DSM 109963]NMN02411.1 ATPase AAA [Bifidobacterium sp. DSM 109963]